MKVVSYLRVSTISQGASGLGLEAQRATVLDFCKRGGFTLDREFVEVESGRKNERPTLSKALAHARRVGATLLVARLDRLSRSVRFIATVLDSGVEFRACDVPDASRLLLHILSAVAEAEAAAISERTRNALQAAKARGVKMGAAHPAGKKLSDEAAARGRAEGQRRNREKAKIEYADVLPAITALLAQGNSLRRIAAQLNADGLTTRKGAEWTAVQVSRVLQRAAA